MKPRKVATGPRFPPFRVVPPRGETFEELLQNLYEAVEGCLSVDVEPPKPGDKGRVLEIAV